MAFFCITITIYLIITFIVEHRDDIRKKEADTNNDLEAQRINAFTVAELHADAVKRAEAEELERRDRDRADRINLENNLEKAVPDIVKMVEKIISDDVKKNGYSSVHVGLRFALFPGDIYFHDICESVISGLRNDGFEVSRLANHGTMVCACVEYIKPSDIKLRANEVAGSNIRTALRVEWNTASALQKIKKI